MSTITTPPILQPPTLPVWRFSVDEYHRLIELGILTEDDPVELLEGLIVPKMPRNPLHDSGIQIGTRLLPPLVPAGWQLRVQCAITTGESEPEPDFAIVRGDERTYRNQHPKPTDISTLMEVSDSSLDRDRHEKGRLYARANILIYWIINLIDRQVEVYTDPTGPDANPKYRQRQDYRVGDSVPLIINGQEVARIAVADLLP